jgi:mRNA m6A methyltransferase catalytic subunit
MHPGGKKIELFGRPDNCMPGWLTLGNQLTDVRLKDPQIIANYRRAYQSHDLSEERMEKNLQ